MPGPGERSRACLAPSRFSLFWFAVGLETSGAEDLVGGAKDLLRALIGDHFGAVAGAGT